LENKLNKKPWINMVINVGPNMANIGCMVKRKAVLITKP
jgi:hypothetical protein